MRTYNDTPEVVWSETRLNNELKRTGKPVTINDFTYSEQCAFKNYKSEFVKKYSHMFNDKMHNASGGLGAEQAITTLSFISKDISEQQFYQIYPADYFPVKEGEGAFDTNTLVYRSFDIADEFETGFVNTGIQSARSAMVDTGVDALTLQHFVWRKSLTYNIVDVKFAAKSGNWSLITQKEITRKRNYDLGVQRLAFLGATGQNGANGNFLGLLNQPTAPVNTTLITGPLSQMTSAELATLAATWIGIYRQTVNFTCYPDRLLIPERDYNGLAAPTNSQFMLIDILDFFTNIFRKITHNPNFKILPNLYCDSIASGNAYEQYVLLSYDPYSVFMSIPLPYTNTLANTLNDFDFTSTAYSQVAGTLLLRPLTLQYFNAPQQSGPY
jgi:hypothetical protein